MHNEVNSIYKNSKNLKTMMDMQNMQGSDAFEVFQMLGLSRPPSVPVLGRRLSSESIITVNDQISSRFPYPIQLSQKRTRRKSLSSHSMKKLDKVDNVKKLQSKLTDKANDIMHRPKSSSVFTVNQCNRIKKNSKQLQPKNASPSKPLLSKQESITKIQKKKKTLRILVSKSIKKHKRHKKEVEVNKIHEGEKQEVRKKEIEEFNKAARVGNFHRFKQKKFKPKLPWGADENKIKLSQERKKKTVIDSRNVRSPPKKYYQFSVSRSNFQNEEKAWKRCIHSNNPEIKNYVLKQKKRRAKSKEIEQEKSLEKENRRIIQLKYLDIMARKLIEKPKKIKKRLKRKGLHRCPEVKWMNGSFFEKSGKKEYEEGNSKSILLENQSSSSKNGRQCIAFGNFENFEKIDSEVNTTNLANDIITKKSNLELDSSKMNSSMPATNNADSDRPSDVKESKGLSFQKKRDKFAIQENLNNKFENLKSIIQSINTQNTEAKAATQIQAQIRGYLTRKKIREYFHSLEDKSMKEIEKSKSWIHHREDSCSEQSYADEDEEVINILGALHTNENEFSIKDYKDYQMKLKISMEKSNITDEDEKVNSKISLSEEKDMKLLSPIFQGEKLHLSEINRRIMQEQKNLDILEQETKEIQGLITPESIKYKKREELEVQRSRDIEEIKRITPEPGSEVEIAKIFHEIVNRRYDNISHMFDENIKLVQLALADPSEQDTHRVEQNTKVNENNKNDEIDLLLKQMIGTQHIKEIEDQILKDYGNEEIFSSHDSPEPSLSDIMFPSYPSPTKIPEICSDPVKSETKNPDFLDELFENEGSHLGSEIELDWAEESQTPNLVLQRELIIDSVIFELENEIFLDIMRLSWTVSPEDITYLSEEMMLAILFNEFNFLSENLRNSMNEENIMAYIFQILTQSEKEVMKKINDTNIVNPLELLAKMQESEIGGESENERSIPVLNSLVFARSISDEIECINIHKRLIFDCVNQCLEEIRNKYDAPWDYLRNSQIVYQNLQHIFLLVKERVNTWNNARAGKIVSSDMFGASGITEEIINHHREERILLLLSQDTYEGEKKWVDYKFEESQLKLDIADMILENLVEEIIKMID